MVERIISKIKNNPYYIVYWLCKYSGLSKISDYVFLKTHWRLHKGYALDFKKPITFAEKLQWIKLYDRNPLYTTMVDKYAVKEYVASKIGNDIIIPTIKVWEKDDKIDLTQLPNQFVLKCTHDSGSIAICRDKGKFDIERIMSKFRKSLLTNYYIHAREWPYKNVVPRIIAEQYLSELSSEDLIDYKFFCFDGNVAYCQVIKDRNTSETIDFFDMKWSHQDFIGLNPLVKNHSKYLIPKPLNFEKMVEYANVLSKGIPFVRVDFYNIDGKIYFGELTFFPANGMGEFSPKEWNIKFGDLIHLPKNKKR